jgi:hypothetical protein
MTGIIGWKVEVHMGPVVERLGRLKQTHDDVSGLASGLCNGRMDSSLCFHSHQLSVVVASG